MRSLYGKLVIITFSIMLFSGLIAFLSVNTYYHQVLKGQNDEKNMRVAETVATFINENEDVLINDYLNTQAVSGYKMLVFNEQKESDLYGDSFRENNLSKQSIDQVLSGETYHGMKNLPSETFVTGFFSDESANTVGVPFSYKGKSYALFLRPDIQMLFTEVHYLLSGMVIVMTVISLLAMLIVAKKLIDPITELTLATKKVREEKFTGELHIHRRDEIGQLAQSFLHMTEQLDENDRIRKEFISDVSHDFQSPLLNIKGYANLLTSEDLSEESRKNYTKVIQDETERLSSLTRQLLLLTSLDQIDSPLNVKRFRLDEQLKESIRKYQWLLAEKQIFLSMELDEVSVMGDPSFLEKVWENLISNAIKYTAIDGEIDIRLVVSNEAVEVIVQDNGIGMDEESKERIFDRFYRVDDARTREVGGTGLGLAIVQQVVKLHGGNVEVVSKKGEGTTFTVTLPRK